MRLLSQKSREYKGKEYTKFWVVIANKLIEKLSWKKKDFLNAEVVDGKLVIAKGEKQGDKEKSSKSFEVTPYEVVGDVDYDKLAKEFGIQKLDKLPPMFNKNVLFRRKVIFAHRDIQRILEAIKGKKKFVMMTGLMPTGKFHLGHMLVAQQMVFYQKLGGTPQLLSLIYLLIK